VADLGVQIIITGNLFYIQIHLSSVRDTPVCSTGRIGLYSDDCGDGPWGGGEVASIERVKKLPPTDRIVANQLNQHTGGGCRVSPNHDTACSVMHLYLKIWSALTVDNIVVQPL